MWLSYRESVLAVGCADVPPSQSFQADGHTEYWSQRCGFVQAGSFGDSAIHYIQDVLLLGWSSCAEGGVLFGSFSRLHRGEVGEARQVEADYSKVDQRVSTDGYIGVEVHVEAT